MASAVIPRDEATQPSKDLGAELALDKLRHRHTAKHAPSTRASLCDARFTPKAGRGDCRLVYTRTRPTRRLGACPGRNNLGTGCDPQGCVWGKRKVGVAEEARRGRSGGVAEVRERRCDASPSPDWARGAATRVGARDGAELSLHTCLTPTLATRQRVDAGCLGLCPALSRWKRLVFV